MVKTPELLFEYLKNIIYHPNKAKLDPQMLDAEYVKFGQGLVFLAECLSEFNAFAENLAKGHLDVEIPPRKNMLVGPLKSIHASLRHITWQSKQVAKGDYTQKIDFMGEFSLAFNAMIEQLKERQKSLENEIEREQELSKALEMNNRILSNIAQYVPHMVFVMGSGPDEIFLKNNMAQTEMESDPQFLSKILSLVADKRQEGQSLGHTEIELPNDRGGRYFSVVSFLTSVDGHVAEIFVISDISDEKALEMQANIDSMTNLFNRRQGMAVLNEWIDKKARFALVFFDLDNLKYINDTYGHGEGDRYIITAANHLRNLTPNSITSRLGGDEFMVLIPDPEVDYSMAFEYVRQAVSNMQSDEYLIDKKFIYNASFGIVALDESNRMSAGQVLNLADERMYANKRERKKNMMAE